ncbi:MAG TPA: ABC transporter substrate-binding protein [Candidatus Methylomirabilis sp.]|nr:ABC transporter substrate-binding protein [Candidatus Methylomirabilis sp.]
MRIQSHHARRPPWIAAVCLGLALIGPGLVGAAGAGEKPKLIVWWNKSYYKEEDEAMQKVAAEFARENNVEVELTFIDVQDLGPKIIDIISLSGVVARRVPDVAFSLWADWQISPNFAWEGKLTDVSDIINELKPRYIESHIKTGWLFNKTENKWSYYAIPIEAQALGTHYWKDLVQEAGLNPDPAKIPMTWREFWAFWKKVQDNLRKKAPAKYGKLYGIGMTESSQSTDTFYNFEQYLLAFRGEVLSPNGKVVAGEAKNREAIVKTLNFFTSIYKEGYVPPDAFKNWTDAGNNENFLNKNVVMTPNPSISIPAQAFFTSRDAYYNKIGSVLQPASPVDGKGYPYLVGVKPVIIPKAAHEPALAKKFILYLLETQHFTEYVRASHGRWFPSFKDVAADPFFNDPKDPHVFFATTQHLKHETRPFYYSYHPAYSQVYLQNIWAKAISRVLTQKWSNEQAADEAINSIQAIFNSWK